MSKQGSSFLRKEKSKDEKSGTKALGIEETETDLHRRAGKTEMDLQREEVTSWTSWVHPSLSCSHGTPP